MEEGANTEKVKDADITQKPFWAIFFLKAPNNSARLAGL